MGFAAFYLSYVLVIASEAKQFSFAAARKLDCFVALLLAMMGRDHSPFVKSRAPDAAHHEVVRCRAVAHSAAIPECGSRLSAAALRAAARPGDERVRRDRHISLSSRLWRPRHVRAQFGRRSAISVSRAIGNSHLGGIARISSRRLEFRCWTV